MYLTRVLPPLLKNALQPHFGKTPPDVKPSPPERKGDSQECLGQARIRYKRHPDLDVIWPRIAAICRTMRNEHYEHAVDFGYWDIHRLEPATTCLGQSHPG